MRKLSLFVLSALLVLGLSAQVWAEMSPSSATGTSYLDNQVFTIAYNNSGSDITSNSIVILDTSATAGSTLGAYITTTATADSNLALGITDETITSGTSGRVCIRGAHRVWMNSVSGSLAGYQIATSTTAGKAKVSTGTTNGNATLGTQLGATATTDSYYGTDVWWVYLRYATQ